MISVYHLAKKNPANNLAVLAGDFSD